MSKGPYLTEEKIAEIVARIAEGMTLKQSCEQAQVGYCNVVKRIGESDVLTKLHAQSRIEYARYQVQRMHDIADTEPDVQRARLKVDVIKWEAARVLPKEFGDKVTQEITGADGGPLQTNLTVTFVEPK